MTCREENNVVWKHDYNAENRISAVYHMDGMDCSSQGIATDTWTYTFAGDGVRVKEAYSGTEASYTKYYFAGGAYEIEVVGETTTTKRYYNFAGIMVAMKEGTEDPIYFASDHLSSASLVMDDSGTLLSENRYMPFGEVREIIGVTNITETDFGYTGQRNLEDIGLMDYNARFYSPTLMRFIQPDTIIPNPVNPQSYNRYSYVNNNPLIFIDPTGHKVICMDGEQCFNVGIDSHTYNYLADPRKDYKAKDPIEKDVDDGGGGGDSGSDNGGGYTPPDIPDWVPGWIGDDLYNIDMALFIAYHPNAALWQRWLAGAYLSGWAYAAISGGTGLALLAYAGWGYITGTGAAACVDDACASEMGYIQRGLDNASRYIPKIKHWDLTTGRFSKFVGTLNQIRQSISQTIYTGTQTISGGKITLVADLAEQTGTKGQTGMKVVLNFLGKIITAFPINFTDGGG